MIGVTTLALALGLATADDTCASPRDVVRPWLGPHPGDATRCAVLPPGLSTADAAQALVDLRRVLDARGVLLTLDDAPDSPDHRDRRTQDARYVPVPSLPGIEVIKTDRGWAFSASTLRSARRLYDETFVVDLARVAERLPPWTSLSLFGVAVWQVLAVVVLVLVGALLRMIASAVAVAKVRHIARGLNLEWSDAVLVPAIAPVGLLVWAGVVGLGLPVIGLPASLSVVCMIAVRLFAATSVVLVAYRIVDVLAETLTRRADKTESRLDDQLVPLLRRALKIAIGAIGTVFVLQNLRVDVASLIAGLGLGGLAFALAAKDTISHLFGSITIFVDKPFQIGDWISTCGVEGIVEEVGFRSTRIRTFYDSVVSIPNGKMTDAVIDNFGRRQYRRTSTTLSVTYGTSPAQLEALCAGIRGIILAHPATRKDAFEVHLAGFGEGCHNVMLYLFFVVPTWSEELRARHEVFLDVVRLAERLGVQFAFPTRTLHVASHAMPAEPATVAIPARAALIDAIKAFGPGGDAVLPPGPRLEPPHLSGVG